jgi:hypothetical protein
MNQTNITIQKYYDDGKGKIFCVAQKEISISAFHDILIQYSNSPNGILFDINEVDACVEFLKNETSQENKITSDQWWNFKVELFDDEDYLIEPSSLGEYYGNEVDEMKFVIETQIIATI